jgi:flavin reductase (DIM6/NTAB) family NADH-FMN oxidoreductase RutF
MRKPIPFDQFTVKTHHLWDKQWLLLTAGDFASDDFNSMTVGWGSFGTMWSKPFAQVVVRPIRYTYEFMERYDTFTLCAFPEEHRQALQFMGTKSGRDHDKVAETGLTPLASTEIAAPGFAEAELIVECRKIYWDDMTPANFLDPSIEKQYPQQHYHRIYLGEIVAIQGESSYRKESTG